MPRLSRYVSALRPSVFATLTEKMKGLPVAPIPLHLGDTFALPPESARWENLDLRSPGNYRYSHPFGLPALLSDLADKVRQHNDIQATPEWIQVTCGATQALHCAVHTLLEPDQKIMVLAPYWPLLGGMVRCLGAQPVEVECTPRLLQDPLSLAQLLEQAYQPGVTALYFSNPNNPDGYVYSLEQLRQLADFAHRHDLWVISDECYEHYLYEGHHHSLAALPGMSERSVTVFSFSKSFAMAGHRLGYAVAHPSIMASLRRQANHTVYNVSPSIQKAGRETLRQAIPFTQQWAPVYARQRLRMAQAFPNAPLPMGGAYFFVDLGSSEAAWDYLERGLQAGVAVAPGAAFGEAYAHCLRICFTCVDEPTLERACQILAALA